jgi:hypothetical protein
MTDAGYVAAGYAVTGGVVLAYVLRLFQRARAAARLLPEERRWR